MSAADFSCSRARAMKSAAAAKAANATTTMLAGCDASTMIPAAYAPKAIANR